MSSVQCDSVLCAAEPGGGAHAEQPGGAASNGRDDAQPGDDAGDDAQQRPRALQHRGVASARCSLLCLALTLAFAPHPLYSHSASLLTLIVNLESLCGF